MVRNKIKEIFSRAKKSEELFWSPSPVEQDRREKRFGNFPHCLRHKRCHLTIKQHLLFLRDAGPPVPAGSCDALMVKKMNLCNIILRHPLHEFSFSSYLNYFFHHTHTCPSHGQSGLSQPPPALSRIHIRQRLPSQLTQMPLS